MNKMRRSRGTGVPAPGADRSALLGLLRPSVSVDARGSRFVASPAGLWAEGSSRGTTQPCSSLQRLVHPVSAASEAFIPILALLPSGDYGLEEQVCLLWANFESPRRYIHTLVRIKGLFSGL